jgi:hypothetical protein
MARFHSLYPWHNGGAYRSLMNAKDHEMLKWWDAGADVNRLMSCWHDVLFQDTYYFSYPDFRVLEFNKFDLYTKDDHGLYDASVDDLWPYYETLIAKYMPGPLRW